MKISKANTILIIVTLLFGGVLFLSVSSKVSVQSAIQTSKLPSTRISSVITKFQLSIIGFFLDTMMIKM